MASSRAGQADKSNSRKGVSGFPSGIAKDKEVERFTGSMETVNRSGAVD
jgi:hypothetical protein